MNNINTVFVLTSVLTWVMVFLSVTVTITTVLAISAIATNGKTISGQSLPLSPDLLCQYMG